MNKLEKNLAISDIEHWYDDRRPSLFLALVTGFVFWVGLIGLILWIGISSARAEAVTATPQSDPLVMKNYPDGTKVVVRWSEVGNQIDNGEKFGGAPRIVAYDPAKDGIVPIGESPAKAAPATINTSPDSSSSVVAPTQPAKMDYTNADPSNFDDQLGPVEGFAFRTGVGPAFQQSLSGRTGGGIYQNITFKPGIRFDLEPAYNGNTGFYQVPVLANVRFQFPSDSPWRGYVGAGVGAGWNVLQASEDIVRPNTYTSYSWNFMYQINTGFTYTIMSGFDLDVGLKMLAAPNPNFQDSGQFKPSYNYSAQIGLAWRF